MYVSERIDRIDLVKNSVVAALELDGEARGRRVVNVDNPIFVSALAVNGTTDGWTDEILDARDPLRLSNDDWAMCLQKHFVTVYLAMYLSVVNSYNSVTLASTRTQCPHVSACTFSVLSIARMTIGEFV
jgi:hypothetical protein